MEKRNGIDAYGRTLANVFLADGTCLNELMIREGYVKPYSKYYCEALKDFQIINTLCEITGEVTTKQFLFFNLKKILSLSSFGYVFMLTCCSPSSQTPMNKGIVTFCIGK